MKILLIGCTGFIGKELIPNLIKGNHEIFIVSRKNINQIDINIEFKNIKFLKLDLSNKKNWLDKNLINYLQDCEAIINLAGEPIADKRWTERQKELIESSRINVTTYLMNSLKNLRATPKVIINGSAIGYYGTSLDDEYNEDSNHGDDFLAKLCLKWEQAATLKPRFTRLVILRIGIVLDADGGALSKMLPIFKIGLGGPIGEGNQWMSWIHRSDLCQIISDAIINKKYKGVYNAVSPDPVKMKTFAKELAKCLNRPNIFPVPSYVLKQLVGEGAKIVLEGQKVKSINLKKNIYEFKYPLLKNALFAATKKKYR